MKGPGEQGREKEGKHVREKAGRRGASGKAGRDTRGLRKGVGMLSLP